jgi:hypothetical protein
MLPIRETFEEKNPIMTEEADYIPPGEILLPQSLEDLEVFLDKIIQDYNLPPSDDTKDQIATMILHMPQTRASIHPLHVATYVRKSIANRWAWEMTQIIKARRDEAIRIAEEAKKLSLVPEGSDASDEPEKPLPPAA